MVIAKKVIRKSLNLDSFQMTKGSKTLKYAHLNSTHHFVPVAVETTGVFGPEVMTLVRELGRRVRAVTGEPRSLQFLLQGTAVAIQRGNAAAVLGTSSPMDNVFI